MEKYRKVVNPIVPSSTTNPTGTGRILSRADKEIERRISGMEKEVIEAFNDIPAYAANASVDDIGLYVYGLSPEQMLLLQETLGAIADKWLVGGVPKGMFWFEPFTEEAANLGLAQSSANLANLSAAYAAARPIESVIYSSAFNNKTAASVDRDYSHWTGLAAEAKTKLSGVIADGVAQGKNPRSVVTDIQTALDVTRSKARQIAQTDIVGTLRETRWAEADAAEYEFGFKVMLLWSSALKKSTRINHGNKHGKIFTTQQVRAFYSQGGEKFNCYCSQVECLVDDEGKLIASDTLKQGMAKQRETWQKENE